MTAAVITATAVSKNDILNSIVSGSNRKIKTLRLEGAKAAQSDWFLLTTYLSAAEVDQILDIAIVEQTSANAHTVGTYTYDSDDAKLVLSSAVVGTATVKIEFYE